MNEDFVMPDVWPGLMVECSRGKGRNYSILGTVIRRKSRAVDIQAITPGGVLFLNDCWHDSDPWIESRGNDAWEDQENRGTWRLTQVEIRNREIFAQVGELFRRVAALEANRPVREFVPPEPPQPQEPQRRTGGRWRRARLGLETADSPELATAEA